MKIELQRVRTIPKPLMPGILYLSEEFGTAQHLCACGCGAKIRTPLGPTEWQVEETEDGPTLRPSVGNWQQPCRSHYWIWRGAIEWSTPWSEKKITDGRRREEQRREQYFERRARERGHNRERESEGQCRGLWAWVKSWFIR
jgi:hypothetical protein